MAKVHEGRHKDVILSSAGITVTLVLADPTIFLSGFSKQEQAERPPALIRGSLIVRVAKATKLKAISLNFKGVSRTDWPEGIPSDKSETHETKEVFAHEWRLFSAQFANAEKSSGAHSVFTLDSEQKLTMSEFEPLHPTATTVAPHELINQHDAVSKGYRVFNPAEYVYNFELMLPQRLPETLKCNFGNVRWGFTLCIERYGTFKPNLTAHKEVTLLRMLGPSNLESSEPIVISRNWEDLLHYEIIIAGKAFAIGQKFNVAFALVPLAKVKCHRIRIYITEHTEYFCRNHRIHRVEPSHKFLLLEHKSPEGNRGDLLKTVGQGMSGLTEFEFNVEIPESFSSRRDHLRPNANTENIKVYHWIKAVMRLSRHDVTHNGEPKCYEVSIDSPVTLVDPRTMMANELPDYLTARRKNSIVDVLRPYQEFIQRESTITAVERGDSRTDGSFSDFSDNSSGDTSQRAILFTRQPSIAPPPFDADVQPPDLLPPQYDITKEDLQQYERRYEEYLAFTGRLPPNNLTQRLHDLTTDTSSDSNTSTLSQNSDNVSGSTVHTAAEDTGIENIAPEARIKTDKVRKDIHEGNSKSSTKGHGKTNSHRDENSVPVFSEIIWTEDTPDEPHSDHFVDPHHQQGASITPVVDPTVNPSPSNTELVSDDTSTSLSPKQSHSSNIPQSPDGTTSTLSPKASDIDTRSPSSPVLQKHLSQTGSVSESMNNPRRSSMTRGSAFNPPLSYNQKMRSGLNSNSISGIGTPDYIASRSAVASRRASSHDPRLPLKVHTPMSVSAGSPLTSPWGESNAPQIFGDRWQERRDSSSSFASPRYFRQSSIVSVDVTRQAVADSLGHGDTMWGARRPSRVSEIQEFRDWHPLSRRNSETSVAISIAEYQGLHSDSRQQVNAPLLGDEDSEVDIGLEWERDFEDIDLENDRSSVVSAVYTVLTP